MNKSKKYPARGRGPHENYARRFPEGVQKRKSNNDDKHDHGQEKRRPSTYDDTPKRNNNE